MKKRLFCLLLVLAMAISILPMFAAAGTADTTESTEAEEPKTATVTIKVKLGTKTLYTYKVTVGDKPVKLKHDKYMTYKDKVYKYSVYTVSGKKTHNVTIPAYDGTSAWTKKWANTISVVYTNHKHSYKPGYNRIYHWSICDCGDTTNEVRHVDPLKDPDKVCSCGYAFSSNAELTTLWFANMQLSPQFQKETTEYIGQVHTYLDVTSTTITARPFDALAKIQLPEDLEIREGANKFEILVTAEDKTTTKTYTVIAVKPVKVEDTLIGTDGTAITATLKTRVKQQTASAEVTEAVAAKLLELALKDGAKTVCFAPEFSKWSVKQTEITLSAELLKAIDEQTEADVTVRTPYDSTLTIPHSELAALVKDHTTVTLRVGKDNTFAIAADGADIAPSALITLTVPQA